LNACTDTRATVSSKIIDEDFDTFEPGLSVGEMAFETMTLLLKYALNAHAFRHLEKSLIYNCYNNDYTT